MASACCVAGCPSRQYTPGVKLIRFPAGSRPFQSKRRHLWLQAIKHPDWTDEKIRNKRICSAHFITGEPSLDYRSPDFVPSVFVNKSQSENPAKIARYHRKLAGDERRDSPKPTPSLSDATCSIDVCPDRPAYKMFDCDLAPSLHLRHSKNSCEASMDCSSPDAVPSVTVNNKKKMQSPSTCPSIKRKRDEAFVSTLNTPAPFDPAEQGSSVDLFSGKDIETEWEEYNDLKLQHRQLQNAYTKLQVEADSLRAENEKLQDALQSDFSKFSYRSIKWDSEQVLSLTGLHSVAFDWLVPKITSSVLRVHPDITPQDHLLIVLMKLKLGLCDNDLGYRYQTDGSIITIICQTWIPALAAVLSPLITWPSEDAILKNKPSIFRRKFKRCRCIIDCLEFTVARPKTFTKNKMTNKKYLIGIAPAGTISFVSPGFSGKISVKQLIKESGFLDLLQHLDQILADRPFPIREELGTIGATLHTPDMTKGKKPALTKKMDSCGQCSPVWSHVKRVVDWWKDYSIFQTAIPASYAEILDDVVTVCAALTNLNMSLVPKDNS